jgi:hypothetical protein
MNIGSEMLVFMNSVRQAPLLWLFGIVQTSVLGDLESDGDNKYNYNATHGTQPAPGSLLVSF